MFTLFNDKEFESELELLNLIQQEQYKLDPVSWLNERFEEPKTQFIWSSFPEYNNHKWDGTPDPFFYAIDSLSKGVDVGIEASTGVGKTYIAARIAFWFLDSFPNSAVITTAPTKEQLLQVLWKEIGLAFPKFKKLRNKAKIITGEIRVNKNIEYDDDKQVVYTNRMLSKVGKKRSGEDSSVAFQGIHNRYQLFLLDEAAALEHSVINAIKNTNSDKSVNALNVILALGNPDSQTDALHQFCLRKSTKHIIVSSYDHPNIVAGTEIPGAVTKESIELRKEEYGENNPFFLSRVRGIAPAEDKDSLIKRDYLERCYKHGDKFNPNEKIDQISYNACGIDVANSQSGDKAAVAIGHERTLKYLHDFQCPNANFIAHNLLYEDYVVQEKMNNLNKTGLVYGLPKLSNFNVQSENVGIDVVGVGVGTINAFMEEGYECIGLQGGALKEVYKVDAEERPLYQFNSLRAQMYFDAMLDLQNGQVIIDIDETTFNFLCKELTTPKYKIVGGHVAVESKEDVKKRLGGASPNLADVFVYWNWMKKGYYNNTGYLPFA